MNKKLYASAKLLSWLLIILSIVGVIFIPMFPWVTTSYGETSMYTTEAMIHSQAKPYLAIWSAWGLARQYDPLDVFEYTLTPQISAVMGLSRSISLISMSFWGCVFFGMFILIALAVYKLQKRFESVSHVLLLCGCISLFPAILIVVGHVQFVYHLSALASEITQTEVSMIFSYNYIPLILGLLVLLVSIVYIKMTFVPALNYFKHRKK